MAAMKRLSMTMILPLSLLAACSDGPTKEESLKVFAAASSAMSSAQSRAVTDARSNSTLAPVDRLDLDYSGPCTLGGTAKVTGSYEGDGADDHAAFDLRTTFTGCREFAGTLDGELHWTSVVAADKFTASMTGGLDWHGNDGDASCDFDLSLEVSNVGISYGGTLCGYDVKTELKIGL
jgi:hypothetical protein